MATVNEVNQTKKAPTTQKQRLAELEEQVERLTRMLSEKNGSEKVVVEKSLDKDDDDYKPIPLDKHIRIISLIPHNLNLNNGKRGKAGTRSFNGFGQMKRLMYSEVADIIDLNWSFATGGYFYILDKDVVKQHGLEEAYASILTKEMMERVISANTDDSFELFKSSTAEQKEVIIDIISTKIKDDPDSVDLNIVDKISRHAGVDILKKAEDSRTLERILSGEEEEE